MTPVGILLVDDHPENLVALEAVLKDTGHNLVLALSGAEALKAVLRQEFALILLDVAMPDLDGYETAELIRSRKLSRSTPIIFLTAYVTSETHIFRGYSVGAVDYLVKPFAPEVLLSKVSVFVELYTHQRAIKESADALKRAYDELEQRVEERTRELEQTVARLEEVERLRMGFLSTVSHELRTPLTSIRGSLGLLASGALGTLSDEVVDVVAIAERNAVRLMALINDILDLERLDTGKIELQFAQVPAESVVHRAIESVATFAQEHGITIAASPVSSTIWADADRIVQVLVNLLSNAVKFSPAAGTVTVAVQPGESWVEFSVTDHGRGVPVAYRQAIFEKFRQVETSDAREKGGSGLGLAICRSIIDQHGGTIGVESAEGGGSTFWFRVATSSRQLAPAVDQPIVVCGDRRGLFEYAIREAGYTVIAVPTDDAAWDLLERTPVAAVLMRSDSELVERLRKDPELHRIPTIVFGEPVVLPPEAVSDDLVLVLPQRFDSRELLVTIRDCLERGRSATLMPGAGTATPS
jgi:signal transduction histidine kinase